MRLSVLMGMAKYMVNGQQAIQYEEMETKKIAYTKQLHTLMSSQVNHAPW